MAFIPVPDGIMAVVEFGTTTVRWSNTLWFEHADVTAAELVNLANSIMLNLETDYVPLMNSNFYIYKVTCYDMSSETGPVGVSTRTAVAGSVAESPSPINGAMVLTLYTGGRGRSSRGRLFLTGWSEESVGAVAISNVDLIDDVTEFFEGFITAMATIGYPWSVCSRYSNKAPRANGILQTILTVNVRKAELGSQRRRIDRD